MEAKRAAAEKAVEAVEEGMTVGLGTGSTAYWAIRKIGDRVREGLKIRAIATSDASERLAKELGIGLVSFADIGDIDITIDGADEVDGRLNLIKGGGGALLREKIVASASKQFIVVVDESKLVPGLGRFPLPVEIVRFGHELTMKRLAQSGCKPVLRMRDDAPFLTDNGHYIADCHFGYIAHPEALNQEIALIPGVVENGLFVRMANLVIAGCLDGKVRCLNRQAEGDASDE